MFDSFPYRLDSEKNLSSNATIEEYFNGIITPLYTIESCNIKDTNELRIKVNPTVLRNNINRFPVDQAIAHINLALNLIERIKALGNKIVGDVKGIQYGLEDYDPQTLEPYPDVTAEQNKILVKTFIEKVLANTEQELNYLKEQQLHRKEQITLTNRNILATDVVLGSEPRPSDINSFKYNDIEKKFDCLTKLRKELIAKKLIDPSTTLANFRKAFEHTKMSEPIIWTGSPTELAYLIKLLSHQTNKLTVAEKIRWKVTCYCFIPKHATSFEPSKLRALKTPANAQEIKKLASIL